jgi:hypothetical protein
MRATFDPAKFQESLAKRSPDRAGDAASALAPVETRPTEHPARFLCFCQFDADGGQESLTAVGNFAIVLCKDDVPALCQRVHERDAEAPGDMTIAGSRGARLFVDAGRCRPCLSSASRFAWVSLAKCPLVV